MTYADRHYSSSQGYSLGNRASETAVGLEKGHPFENSNVSVAFCVGGQGKELATYASQQLTTGPLNSVKKYGRWVRYIPCTGLFCVKQTLYRNIIPVTK